MIYATIHPSDADHDQKLCVHQSARTTERHFSTHIEKNKRSKEVHVLERQNLAKPTLFARPFHRVLDSDFCETFYVFEGEGSSATCTKAYGPSWRFNRKTPIKKTVFNNAMPRDVK